MGKVIIGMKPGAPDHSYPGRFKNYWIRSDKSDHFTDEIAQNGVEEENLPGLLSNRIIITSIKITSKESRHFRVSFYGKDAFTSSDLDSDSFQQSIELNLPRYAQTMTFAL